VRYAVLLHVDNPGSWCSEIASVPEEHGVEDYRFNDGKISPAGVFIGGRMHSTGAELDGKHSHWYRLEWHKEQKKSRLVQVSSRLMQLCVCCSQICFTRPPC